MVRKRTPGAHGRACARSGGWDSNAARAIPGGRGGRPDALAPSPMSGATAPPPLNIVLPPHPAALLRTILDAKEAMGKAFKDGNFALAEVKYAAGDIKSSIIESVGLAQKRVETRIDNIAGVKVIARHA